MTRDNDIDELKCFDCDLGYDDCECGTDPEEYPEEDDVWADADTLASAGWGTDEDYGYYGEDDF